jgi:hypothetical protein
MIAGSGRRAAPRLWAPRTWGCALLTGLLAGCAANVSPPATLTDAVPIYFLRYNVHSSIILPRDGKYIEYSYGDWNYAALRHKWVNDALGALFVSGDSTFERRIIEIDPRSGEPDIRDDPDLVIRMYADREAVRRRLEELDARFERDMALHREDGLVIYADAGETYVKDTEHYSIANNCNDLTAETLRALGFRVDGPTFSNQFHMARPQVIKEEKEGLRSED